MCVSASILFLFIYTNSQHTAHRCTNIYSFGDGVALRAFSRTRSLPNHLYEFIFSHVISVTRAHQKQIDIYWRKSSRPAFGSIDAPKNVCTPSVITYARQTNTHTHQTIFSDYTFNRVAGPVPQCVCIVRKRLNTSQDVSCVRAVRFRQTNKRARAN